MSFVTEQKKAFMAIEAQCIEIDGLPTFYVKPMTIFQAQEIDAETDQIKRLARHFSIRARDAEDRPIVAPGEFDDFLRFTSLDLISKAVVEMAKVDTTIEDAEKN